MRCDAVATRLARAAGDLTGLNGADRGHVESCLRCQAEVVHERRLQRAFQDLRTDLLEPAPGWLADVLDALEQPDEQRAVRSVLRGRRVTYAGAIVVAGGALVIAGRARRRLPLAG